MFLEKLLERLSPKNEQAVIEADIASTGVKQVDVLNAEIEKQLIQDELDDINDALENDSEKLAEGQSFAILYEDAKGNETERLVTLFAISKGNDNPFLKCRCHLRKRIRNFRVDRIIEVYDVDGEIHNPTDFLVEFCGMNESWLSKPQKSNEVAKNVSQSRTISHQSWPKCKAAMENFAILFASLSLSDGVMCENEIDIAIRALDKHCSKNGFVLDDSDIDKIQRYFRRLRPNLRDRLNAIEYVLELDSRDKEAFIQDCIKVILADGIIDEAEEEMFSNFASDIVGHNLKSAIIAERSKLNDRLYYS